MFTKCYEESPQVYLLLLPMRPPNIFSVYHAFLYTCARSVLCDALVPNCSIADMSNAHAKSFGRISKNHYLSIVSWRTPLLRSNWGQRPLRSKNAQKTLKCIPDRLSNWLGPATRLIGSRPVMFCFFFVGKRAKHTASWIVVICVTWLRFFMEFNWHGSNPLF